MANCFDKNRGIKSGRISPSSVSPHEGEKVFVLGADGDTEPAVLTNGDYAEITQRVDLSSAVVNSHLLMSQVTSSNRARSPRACSSLGWNM